uniref:hypothetical protein n=1 Tax=Catenulispora rubra TaxID=280293 RepID=UPI0018921851
PPYPPPEPATTAAAERVRKLARNGALARSAALTTSARAAISGGVYAVAWPIVFSRITRRAELRHGHLRCAQAVHKLAPECLDRFHDDVEAVVQDTLQHADRPIRNLDAWIAARLTAATVNAHRRARGSRGALQRPRVPKWLAAALGEDPWYVDLAMQILVWAGLPGTAGSQLWPLDAWTQRRGEVVGDWAGANRVVLRREIDLVLAAMRQRERWYTDYVERPLGRKETPTVSETFSDADGPGPSAEPAALALAEPYEVQDGLLLALAKDALTSIRARIDAGQAATDAVVDVVGTLFGEDSGSGALDLEYAPHESPSHSDAVSTRLRDSAEVERIVASVLGILGDGVGDGIGGDPAEADGDGV